MAHKRIVYMGHMAPVNRDVLNYINLHGSITSKEASNDLSQTRLSARIHDLRTKYGIPIKTIHMNSLNRHGNTVTYAKYEFKGDENENEV